MHGGGKAVGNVSGEHGSSWSSLDANGRAAPTLTSASDSSLVLANTPPRQGVSYWACSKLCTICFVAGLFFGYTLRGRLTRWASKFLKKLT